MIIGNSTGFNESQIWSRNYYSNNVVYTLGYYPKMLPQITPWSLFRNTVCNCMHLFRCLALEMFGQRTKKTRLPDCVGFDTHCRAHVFGHSVIFQVVFSYIIRFFFFLFFNTCQFFHKYLFETNYSMQPTDQYHAEFIFFKTYKIIFRFFFFINRSVY